MEIPFSAREFGAGAQMGIILNFEEQFPVINMYGWYGQGLFTMENVIIMYLSIVLDIVIGESSFKLLENF